MTFRERIHPEYRLDGFTKLDGTITFYSCVRGLMLRTESKQVLDFGAGRGQFWTTELAPGGSLFRRSLHDMRFNGATVTACDIDSAVLTHPCSHQQIVIQPGQPLPFDTGQFDVIVSDFTFEHIADPAPVCRELLRVLRPGGYVCARTPNKYGYVKIFSQLVPNRLHTRYLRRIQPDRQPEDVFPTTYKLNSLKEVKRYFPGCEVVQFFHSGEPAYFFGSSLLYRVLLLVHALLPSRLATSVCFFIRKPGASA